MEENRELRVGDIIKRNDKCIKLYIDYDPYFFKREDLESDRFLITSIKGEIIYVTNLTDGSRTTCFNKRRVELVEDYYTPKNKIMDIEDD